MSNATRDLIIKVNENTFELTALNFHYQGQINTPFTLQVQAVFDGQHSEDNFIKNWVGQHATLDIADQGIEPFHFSGWISRVAMVHNPIADRNEYQFVLRASHADLDRRNGHKVYAQASIGSVITDLIAGYSPHSKLNYNPERFDLFQSQEEGHYNQVLHGSLSDFFHYQLNLHGFYYPSFAGEQDTLNIIPDLNHLPTDTQHYVHNMNNYKPSQSNYAGSGPLIESLDSHSKNNRIKGHNRYYSHQEGLNSRDELYSRQNTLTGNYAYQQTSSVDEQEEADIRIDKAVHALDQSHTLVGKNIINTEGHRVSLQTIRGGRNETKSYWIYAADIKGELSEDQHWQVSTELELLPLLDSKSESYTETDALWYPKPLPSPQVNAHIPGARYNAKASVSKQGELPIQVQAPFTNTKQQSDLYCRAIQPSSSRDGGMHSRAKLMGEAILERVDNAPNEFVIGGWLSNSTVPDMVHSANIENTAISSGGNVALTMKRRRYTTPYSSVGLLSEDGKGRKSGI
ncbi:MAG: hypothetical protein ACJA0H_002478, partial [Francisellaceae bacterium]